MRKLAKAAALLLAVGLTAMGVIRLRKARVAALQNVAPPQTPPWMLRVAKVRKATATVGFESLATVKTGAELTIGGQLPGTIVKMGPREGETVHRGDLLALIDTREIDQQIKAQEAKLAAARSDHANKKQELERERELLKSGGSSQSKVDSWLTAELAARQTVESLQRLIDALKVRRGYARIQSPVDGVVAARMAEPGDLCQLGHPLFRITVSQGARIQVMVPQSVIEKIHPGSVMVLRHGNQSLRQTISRVFPSLDELALGRAEADAPTTPFGLPSGARVAARVITDERVDALVVPRGALLKQVDGRHAAAFKVAGQDDESTVERVRVVIDLETDDGVAVLGDLKVGDRLVVGQQTVLLQLATGDPIRVWEDENRR